MVTTQVLTGKKYVAQPPPAVSDGKSQPGAAVPHMKQLAYLSSYKL